MSNSVYAQAKAALSELAQKANLKKGNIVVVGCSTSEVVGSRIGTNSNFDVAGEIFRGLSECAQEYGFYLAIQCCEHLNRAIITERAAVPFAQYVNVVPQPKAGGSLATQAYGAFAEPVALEAIQADAGLDIGLTLIGMHLKEVAVPMRISTDKIGNANLICAYTRPKYIGGPRAEYE